MTDSDKGVVVIDLANTYELEFAIDAPSELVAIEMLGNLIPSADGGTISINDLGCYGDLFFVKHRFKDAQITDDVYKKILDDDRIEITYDELALERSRELLKACLPAERCLKRLLMYIYVEFITCSKGNLSRSDKMAVCKAINHLSFGKITENLNRDIVYLSSDIIRDCKCNQKRFKLNKADEVGMTLIDAIRNIIEFPASRDDLLRRLTRVKNMRNNAAHVHVILESDLQETKKDAQYLIIQMSLLKKDYQKLLIKAARDSFRSISKIMRRFPFDDIAKAAETTLKEIDLPKGIGKVCVDAIYSANPELLRSAANTLSKYAKSGAKTYGVLLSDFERRAAAEELVNYKNEIDKMQAACGDPAPLK